MSLVFALSVAGCGGENKQASSSSSSSAQAAEQKQVEQTTEKATNDTEKKSSPPTEEKAARNYDTLQTIFTQIDTTTSPNVIENVISSNNLAFTKQTYSGTPKQITYKIAYNDDVALQKHGISGDYLSIR